MYQQVVFAFAAASIAMARPSGDFVSVLTGSPRAIHDLPVGRTAISRADMQEMARLAIAVNTAYCPIDRNLQPHPSGASSRHVGSDGYRHASSVIISSQDEEFENTEDGEVDMNWYISHTPATQTLTLAFSSLTSTDELLDLLTSSPEDSTSIEDELVDLPDFLFPPEHLPFQPAPRMHHSYAQALDGHGTTALLALLDLLETPPVSVGSSSGNVLQKFIDSITGVTKPEEPTQIKRVEIVGHGLGASMGLLVALALHLEVSGPAAASYENPLPEVDIAATLFGLPRVGDDTFATWVDEIQLQYANFRVNRVISYADTVPHLPERHLDLVHPSIGEIWVGADPRLAYACRSDLEGEESEDCAASIPLSKTSLLDHAGPFAGVWIGQSKCRRAEEELLSMGLAIISKKRPERVRAIAAHIASASYDIVCLQECWIYKDYELIRDEVSQSLPYSRFFNSGALGSGLAIFTRFPITFAQVMPFDLTGTPQQAIAGDFFVNKAAAHVVISHPILGELEVWTTHMHAGGEGTDLIQAHRIGESWQLANAIRAGAARGRHVMVMGDFNSQPFSIPIAIMRHQAGVIDTFLETHPRANVLTPLPPSPEAAIRDYGMSCDSSLNSWSAEKNIPAYVQKQGGKRLDYIFYRCPEEQSMRRLAKDKGPGTNRTRAGASMTLSEGLEMEGEGDVDSRLLRCTDCEMVLTDLVPGTNYSYSDHAGILATFSIGPTPSRPAAAAAAPASDHAASPPSSFSPKAPTSFDSNASNATASLLPQHTNHHHPHPHPHPVKATYALHASHASILTLARDILRQYTAVSRSTGKLHLRLSAASLVLLLGLTVGSAWQPISYVQPVFTLVGGVLGAACVTLFYLGFAWARWEAGMMAELEEQISLELRMLEAKDGKGP